MFPWNLFPFNNDMKKMLQQMKPDEIEKYVQDMMSKMFPSHLQGMMNPQEMLNGIAPMSPGTENQPRKHTLDASLFETHDHVFVRIPVEDEEWLKQMRIFHTSNHFMIENVPEIKDKHSLVLPALVKKKGSVAQYKDGMLEVKLIKSIDMQFSEIDVNEVP